MWMNPRPRNWMDGRSHDRRTSRNECIKCLASQALVGSSEPSEVIAILETGRTLIQNKPPDISIAQYHE